MNFLIVIILIILLIIIVWKIFNPKVQKSILLKNQINENFCFSPEIFITDAKIFPLYGRKSFDNFNDTLSEIKLNPVFNNKFEMYFWIFFIPDKNNKKWKFQVSNFIDDNSSRIFFEIFFEFSLEHEKDISSYRIYYKLLTEKDVLRSVVRPSQKKYSFVHVFLDNDKFKLSIDDETPISHTVNYSSINYKIYTTFNQLKSDGDLNNIMVLNPCVNYFVTDTKTLYKKEKEKIDNLFGSPELIFCVFKNLFLKQKKEKILKSLQDK